jgi:hypothetical protein
LTNRKNIPCISFNCDVVAAPNEYGLFGAMMFAPCAKTLNPISLPIASPITLLGSLGVFGATGVLND